MRDGRVRDEMPNVRRKGRAADRSQSPRHTMDAFAATKARAVEQRSRSRSSARSCGAAIVANATIGSGR
jgi:hypothetical protein